MYLNEILPGNWREDEWPEHIEVSHEASRFRRYKVDEVKLIFDSTEEDARVEEVDVVRNYDVTRSPFFAFDMKGECREVEHQTRIHVPEGSWGEYQFNVN